MDATLEAVAPGPEGQPGKHNHIAGGAALVAKLKVHVVVLQVPALSLVEVREADVVGDECRQKSESTG